MRTKCLLLFLALLTALAVVTPAPSTTVAASRAAVTVFPGRPRLIVGGYRGISVAQMQARCADPAFQGECDNIGSTGHVDDEAMDYLLHDDTGAADNVIYALQHDSLTCSYERSNVGGYALAYDWVYNYISTQGIKDDIEGRLADCAVTISNTLGTNGPHLWHGYTSAAAALALVALSLDHDSRRATLLETAERLFRGNALEAYAYVDGAWPEGISYLRSHFFSSDPPRQYVLDAVHAWHSAVQEEDIYETIANGEGDWLRRLGYFHIYHLLPPYGSQTEHTWTRHGDMPSWRPEPSNQHRPYTDVIADAYDDSYLQQIGTIIEDDWGFVSGQGSYHRIHRYALPTNMDPSLSPTSFDDLPSAAIFGRDTSGYVAIRAGWSDETALIFYRAGDWFTGHQHMDQGHFEIWRRGPLALDSGVYANWGTEHREAYYIRTVAHNSLLIRQPGETFAHGYSAGDTNDGGQRVHTYAGPGCAQCIQSVSEYESNVGAGQHYEAGDITAFFHTDAYDYVASDITPAYNSTAYTYGSNSPKVEIVQRELAYLRPDVLLIFDRVRSTDATYEKAWLLHSSTKPQTGSETIVQGNADNGILTSDDDIFSVDNGSGGRLIVQTLLPADHTTRKIGGSDYRYWSDGANRDGGVSSHETGHAEPGLWRVEVVPGTAQADDLFLHTIYITATTASAMPSTSLLTTSGGEMSGAHVQEPGRERVALFSAAMDGTPVAGGVQYDVISSGECGHLLTGVLSDTTYRITAGTDEQTVTSSVERTLYFTTTQSGALHVSVAPLGAPPAAVTDLRVDRAVVGSGTLSGTLTAALRWTAPVNAVTYTLRYSDILISEADWASATAISVPFSASAPGSTEWLTTPVPYTGDPSAGSGHSTVYFALKSQNTEGVGSGLSNNAFWPHFDVYLPLTLRVYGP